MLVLGKVHKWFIYCDAVSHIFLPKQDKNHIKNELSKIIAASGFLVNVSDDHFNSICCVPARVSGDQGSVLSMLLRSLVV